MNQRGASVRAWILRLAVAAPVAVGALVLLGWALESDALKRLVPLEDQPTVKANTAVCLATTAIALALLVRRPVPRRRRRTSRVLAGLVVSVGVLTLVEYAFDVDLGIDQLLAREEPDATRTSAPGRMADNTAIVFVLFGVALLGFEARWRGRRVANLLAAAAGTIAVLALIGLLLGADEVPVFSQHGRMAVATAFAVLLLAAGIVMAREETGTVRLLTGAGPASQAARRLLPAILVVPALLGYLRLEGQRAGLYGTELGAWLLVVSLTAGLGGVAWSLIHRLSRAELRSQEAERAREEARVAAERANAAKSEFISRMSHELRTPMNSVLGFAQLMQMHGVEERHRPHVEHILRSGRHLLELIDEMLDLSRIEAGKLSISSEPVHVAAAVEEAVGLMMPLASERDIAVEVQQGDDLYVTADHQRLRQVLLNLLSNAVKYNVPQGRVTVAWEHEAERVQIRVSDTGVGIPVDDVDKLFVPFERLSAAHGQEQGTGLGLALTRRLLDLMGGEIRVTPLPAGGTSFTITLPVATPASPSVAAAARRQAEPSVRHRELDVVYIEDNLTNLRLVEAVLESRRATIRSAAEGAAGLELLAARRPDAVLLDLHLPDIPGLDVLRLIRRDPETRGIPVIILTADATKSTRRRALELGADGYLAKPLDVAIFLETLEAVTGASAEAAAAAAATTTPRAG